jgi:hypothetical protein
MTDTRLLAVELLAVADALHSVAQRIDCLQHADRIDGADVVVIRCNTPSMVAALESLAQQLGGRRDDSPTEIRSPRTHYCERRDGKPPARG